MHLFLQVRQRFTQGRVFLPELAVFACHVPALMPLREKFLFQHDAAGTAPLFSLFSLFPLFPRGSVRPVRRGRADGLPRAARPHIPAPQHKPLR